MPPRRRVNRWCGAMLQAAVVSGLQNFFACIMWHVHGVTQAYKV